METIGRQGIMGGGGKGRAQVVVYVGGEDVELELEVAGCREGSGEGGS